MSSVCMDRPELSRLYPTDPPDPSRPHGARRAVIPDPAVQEDVLARNLGNAAATGFFRPFWPI